MMKRRKEENPIQTDRPDRPDRLEKAAACLLLISSIMWMVILQNGWITAGGVLWCAAMLLWITGWKPDPKSCPGLEKVCSSRSLSVGLALIGLAIMAAGLLFSSEAKTGWFLRQMHTVWGWAIAGIMAAGFLLGGPWKASRSRFWQGLNFCVQTVLLVGMAFVWYASGYYPADSAALKALKGTEDVHVEKLEKTGGWLFDGPGTSEALVFYPGALVDPVAYAPLMEQIASTGTDCFLMEMPWNLAVLASQEARNVMEDPRWGYQTWNLGGHSLGAAMAATLAAQDLDVDGLMLLGGYSIRKLPDHLKVLLVYGSEDGVLNRRALETNASHLPEDTVAVELEGGNHAGFGDYGPQKNDGMALVSPERQQEETTRLYVSTLGKD